jgi:hypothetical protein
MEKVDFLDPNNDCG